MDKTDLRVVKTFRQIDEILLQELEKSTIDSLTVTELCRRAMIHRSTFYRYYRDLEDCLNQYLDRLVEAFRSGVNTGFLAAAPWRIDDEAYQAAFRELTGVVRENARAFRAVWNAKLSRDLREEMVEANQQAMLRSLGPDTLLTPVPYHRLYSRLFAEHTLTLLRWWLENEDRVTEEDIQRIMTENMKLGLFAAYKRQI